MKQMQKRYSKLVCQLFKISSFFNTGRLYHTHTLRNNSTTPCQKQKKTFL